MRRQVAQLQLEREGLQRVLDGLEEGVIAVDRAGLVVHANEAAGELLGMDIQHAIGHHMFAVVPSESVCEALESVMRPESVAQGADGAPGGDQGLRAEVLLSQVLGEPVTATIHVRPLRPRAGGANGPHEDEGAIAIVRDVTELRRLERTRADFFANVSHELKTPVTAIRGSVETMLDDEGMPPETRRRFLDKARSQALRLSALVADLLTLARLESGPEALQQEVISLVVPARAALDTVADHAHGAGITLRLTVEAPEHELLVAGDPEALRTASGNLVGNALAHSDAGGEVVVRLAREADLIVRLSVEDQGIGIEPQHLDRVFERFYRVDAARSRARGGTGIGLSIVKHVVAAHGGGVTVRSTPGIGSTFEVHLPAALAGPRPPVG